ncbi:MAG: hypothetical protein R3D03_04670 [Geminicoccaceae bacterium]
MCVLERRQVLERIDLVLRPGRDHQPHRPNRSGQVDAHRLVLGIIRPTCGRIRRRPGLTTSYVPQKLHVDHDPADDGGALSRPARRIGRSDRSAGTGGGGRRFLLDRPMLELSGGELQRVLWPARCCAAPTCWCSTNRGRGWTSPARARSSG